MDILDILTVILPKEIYQFVIIYGFVYFILIFYGTKQWEKYSSFEKVVFSVLSGYVVWVFLVTPISFFLNTLKVFQHELPEIKYIDLYQYSYILHYIFIYLIIWRLLFSDKPLRDNKTFFNFTKYLIIATMITFFIADYIYFAALLFSGYQEYLGYPIYSILYLSATVIFYLIFLEIYGEKIIRFSKIKDDSSIAFLNFKAQYFKYLISKNEKRIRQIIAVIFIIVLIAVLFVGKYYLKTTTQMVEEEPHKLVIDDLFINRPNFNLSGEFFVWQNYSIKFGLIPWAKIKLNLSSVDESDKTKTPDYNFSGNYLFIKNASWNTINVKLYGWKQEYNISEFHTLKISDLNDTIQRWDINFYNHYPYYIEIYEVVVEKGNLKLINYVKNLALGEVVNNPTDHQITIKHVELPKYWLPQYANHSISLFFKKNNS